MLWATCRSSLRWGAVARQGFPARSHCETRHWIPINFISLAKAYKFTCTRIKVITGRSLFNVNTGMLVLREEGVDYRAICGVSLCGVLFFIAITNYYLELSFYALLNLLGVDSRKLMLTTDSQTHLLELVGRISTTGGCELGG